MMRSCGERKQFSQEWEAVAWIHDNPREEPAAPLYPYHCLTCHQWHVGEYPKGNDNAPRRKRRR